ncbi:MAG: type 1 glutamine amidotransferase [Pseudomonadota bacterium]
MHIGILQCGHTPDQVAAVHGDYDNLFITLFDGQGLTFKTWDVVDMAFPDSIDAAEGWLITGSKHGAYEDHAFIPPLEDFIRAAHVAEKPMIGICFGHQIIAQALGGRVEKFAGGWAVGRHAYDVGGETIHLNAWHQDQVVERPQGARRVAGSEFCENAALVYGEHIMTVQPHPEISNSVLASYLDARAGDPNYPDGLFQEARSHLETPTDDLAYAARLATFLKEARP